MRFAAWIAVGSLTVSLGAVFVAWDANRRADRRERTARSDAQRNRSEGRDGAERIRREERDRAERRAAYAAFISAARGFMYLGYLGQRQAGVARPTIPEVQQALWEASGPIRLIAPDVVDAAVTSAITSVVIHYIDLDNDVPHPESPAREITEAELAMRADLRDEWPPVEGVPVA